MIYIYNIYIEYIYIFCFFDPRDFSLTFKGHNNNLNGTFPLYLPVHIFPFVLLHFGVVLTYCNILSPEMKFHQNDCTEVTFAMIFI